MKNIVTIGGGTGSYTVLSGLKKLGDINLSAIVAMSDSGGSTGILRDELGVLPPGDVRQCLVALSEHSDVVRKLMTYRFEKGGLSGHNFGNLLLAALEKTTGSFTKAVSVASDILKIKGQVVPVTADKANLVVLTSDGKEIKSEVSITNHILSKTIIKKIFYEGKVKLSKKAKLTILHADYIIIGPGDFYCSLVPNLIVNGFQETLAKSKTKIILLINLTNKHNHTLNWKASHYVKNIEKFIGKKIDIILLNNQKPSLEQIKLYKISEGDGVMVMDDLGNDSRVVRADMISHTTVVKNKTDVIKRSFIRHDPDKIADIVSEIINKDSVKFIFDFDDTLFDTKSFKENMFLSLEKEGIARNVSRKYYKNIRNFHTPFSLKLFLYSLFEKEKKEKTDIEKIYGRIMNICSNLLNKELLKIIKKVGKNNCYIVTDGDEEFQLDKIKKAGIHSLFSEINIVQGSKKEAVESICVKNKNSKIIFIDNFKKSFTDIDLGLCKKLKTILFTGNNIKEIEKEIKK